MAKKVEEIISPAFSFVGTLPSIVRSALISLGAIVVASIVYFIAIRVFPQADFSQVYMAITTGLSAWMINLLKVYVEEKK